MRHLPRAPRINNIPIHPKTGIDLLKAGRDLAMKRFVPTEIKNERVKICQGCDLILLSPSNTRINSRC